MFLLSTNLLRRTARTLSTRLIPAISRRFTVQKQEIRFDAVIHFAGLKAVGESVEKPLLYLDEDLTSLYLELTTIQKMVQGYVRDYIHVIDLVDGHIAALRKLDDLKINCEVYNVGTGNGTSVLEMVSAFEKASGKVKPKNENPLVMAGRRPGDAEVVYASTEKAERELNWKAKYGIDEMCRDLWNWASNNPYGYNSSSNGSST